MLTLSRCEQIHLPTARRESSRILAADPEQNQLRDISELETDASSIRAAVFTNLVPNDIRFVVEAPRFHHREAFRQQRVRTPQIKVRRIGSDVAHRQGPNLVELHRSVARKALVLRRYFAGLVCELPRRIGEDRAEPSSPGKIRQV